jgi:hypothetical protein
MNIKKTIDKWFTSLLVVRIMAILALGNLGLVLFNLSYIPLRDVWLLGRVRIGNFQFGPIKSEGFYLKFLPNNVSKFIVNYDAIKGIVPNRDTNGYLKQVDKLQSQIDDLNSPEVAKILADLRQRSEEMIDTNPFQLANKTGTLERIKNEMRQHIPNPDNSAKQAFRTFWNQEYLKGKTVEEMNFFNKEIRPLMETNYFRPMGETGDFVDYFGLIDFPFFVIFAIDFLGRTWYISRRYIGVSWIDAMLWRWYDIFLLIPLYRWLRIIPVTVRLNQAKLINLDKIRKQSSQGFVASIAQEITEVVIVEVINQTQNTIRQEQFTKILSQTQTQSIKPEYIDLNEINETAEITKLMVQLIVVQVLPKIRPDVEDLLEYNFEKVFKQLPLHQGLQYFPGVEALETKLIQQVSQQIYQVFLDALNTLIKEDPAFDEILNRLVASFTQTIRSEIQAQQSIEKIQSLLVDLLEEVKINYVKRLSEEDIEKIMEQTRIIRKKQ